MTNEEKIEEIISKYAPNNLENTCCSFCKTHAREAAFEMAKLKDRLLEEYRNNVIKAANNFIMNDNAKYHSVDEVKEKFIEMIKNIEL